MRRFCIVVLYLGLMTSLCWAADRIDPADEKARTSYSVGYQVGSDFRRQGIDIDPDLVLQGALDALSGDDSRMTAEEMRKALTDLQKKVTQASLEKEKQADLETLADGEAFLKENGKREGVRTLPSGLQYKVITVGEGAPPRAEDTVTVHYRGTLIDGAEFDSSYKRNKPATFKLNQVIKGWTEGLQLMNPGAKYMLFIPPDLAYEEVGAGKIIKPYSTLIFEVELLSVEGS
jgi:FKBP-type peptidyl-prolyl cis-trans isomerase FklB